MPLRERVAEIEHESALQAWQRCQRVQRGTVWQPQWLADAFRHVGRADGVHIGDTVLLYGKSGSGKSYLLQQIVADAGGDRRNDPEDEKDGALILMLDRPWTNMRLRACDHALTPKTRGDVLALIHGLDAWLHAHPHTSLVLVDGEAELKMDLVAKLVQLQREWPFALFYTFAAAAAGHASEVPLPYDLRIDCYRQDTTRGNLAVRLLSKQGTLSNPVEMVHPR
ncbi:hypothetical protein BC940DRAFT_368547 [Gongronella butleri]|nr:hypothetical protein BC940DRAFT_368547 [Gongronella butleri]